MPWHTCGHAVGDNSVAACGIKDEACTTINRQHACEPDACARHDFNRHHRWESGSQLFHGRWQPHVIIWVF